MTRKELEDWLQTEESQSVGQSDDVDHMRRVVSYVHRRKAQKPKGDVENSTWRYSLTNWGHDPLMQPSATPGDGRRCGCAGTSAIRPIPMVALGTTPMGY
jgi:uncharacterized protein DUF3140